MFKILLVFDFNNGTTGSKARGVTTRVSRRDLCSWTTTRETSTACEPVTGDALTKCHKSCHFITQTRLSVHRAIIDLLIDRLEEIPVK